MTGSTGLLAVLNILVQTKDCQLRPVFLPTGLFCAAVFWRSGPVRLAVFWQSMQPDLQPLAANNGTTCVEIESIHVRLELSLWPANDNQLMYVLRSSLSYFV